MGHIYIGYIFGFAFIYTNIFDDISIDLNFSYYYDAIRMPTYPVNTNLNKRLYEEFSKICEEEGVSRYKLLRRLIEEYINERSKVKRDFGEVDKESRGNKENFGQLKLIDDLD